jgi:short-subunit dehydrogenase
MLPAMQQRQRGHVVNISSIGVLTNAPRFSAYVASKAAMDAFARCAASEFADSGVEFTTVNMPLVRTAMTAPTELYRQVPMLSPEEAAELVAQAIIQRPTRVATRLGIFAQVVHLVAPRLSQLIMNTAYRAFPESRRALSPDEAAAKGAAAPPTPTPDQIAFAQLMKGIHF